MVTVILIPETVFLKSPEYLYIAGRALFKKKKIKNRQRMQCTASDGLFLLSDLSECLLNILYKILRILDTYGQTNQLLTDTCGLKLI